jgi:hypothetical protein
MSWTLAASVPPARAALFGVVLSSPAALFLGANLLNELGVGGVYRLLEPALGFLGSPVLLLGGLATAVALNLLAVARLDVASAGRRFTCTLAIDRHHANLALLAAAGLMLATVLAYGLVENFRLVPTHL